MRPGRGDSAPNQRPPGLSDADIGLQTCVGSLLSHLRVQWDHELS